MSLGTSYMATSTPYTRDVEVLATDLKENGKQPLEAPKHV